MASTPGGTLAHGALPALIDCCLEWDVVEGHMLHVTPASFSGALVLICLTLGRHEQLQLAPSCFSGLSMLVDLNLYCSRLTAIPAALSGVGRTLRQLGLSRNPQLQIDQAGFDTLLALQVLESLDLTDSAHYENRWTSESTRFLVKFFCRVAEAAPRGAAAASCNLKLLGPFIWMVAN